MSFMASVRSFQCKIIIRGSKCLNWVYSLHYLFGHQYSEKIVDAVSCFLDLWQKQNKRTFKGVGNLFLKQDFV